MISNMGWIEKTAVYLLLIAFGFMLIAPFIYMVSIALTGDATTAKATFTFFPAEFHFENFIKVFTEKQVGAYILNSSIITGSVIVGTLLSSSFVAFGFARLRAPGSTFWFLVLLSTMMLPQEVTLIPQFVIFRTLNWVDTFLPLIVPSIFAGAFNIFLIRQFMMRIPRTYDEAAKIDGMGYFGIYSKIMMPLIYPILVAVAIFAFTWSWGDFLGPLIYINSPEKTPLALGVQLISATTNAGSMPAWNIVMVASMLLTVPMVAVYYFGQRYIYEANISGGSAGIK